MRYRRIPVRLLAPLAAILAGVTACGTATTPAGPSSPTPATSPASPAPATSPATPTTAPASCPDGWRTAPLTVTRDVAVPPVPVATGIRTGSHPDCRFDRLVIDISGAMPGYSVSFVTKVTRDASGQLVRLPGTAFLLIRLTPAQGHGASAATDLPQHIQIVGYPMLRAYAVTGDFEGVLSVGLGLAGPTRYRVGELPGRIYLDVAW
jgi:hypothetical protein